MSSLTENKHVKISGIATNASLKDVEECLMYCGKIFSVKMISDVYSGTGRSAIVEFDNSNSAEIAQLLSETVFKGHKIYVYPYDIQCPDKSGFLEETKEELKESTQTHPDTSFVAKLQYHKIAGICRETIEHLRYKAVQANHDIPIAASRLRKCLEERKTVIGREPTTQQWDYTPSQPQWGVKYEW